MRDTLKEEILVYLLEKHPKKPKRKDLERFLKIRSTERKHVSMSIRELEKEGLLVYTKKKQLMLLQPEELVVGTFYGNPKGYGFVTSSKNKKDVYFIAPVNVHHALHEDVVVAKIHANPEDKKPEAVVLAILQRRIEVVVGTYMNHDTFGYVVPDNQKINMDIYIPEGFSLEAKSYDKVTCKIVKYPERSRNPEGIITEVIGFKFERGVDLLSVIREHNLRDEFPLKVIKQVEKLPTEIGDEELSSRRDLRAMSLFTIDGEDAKDLDDAVSIERLGNGRYYLGVHIADVSHYVKEDSKVDKEALERGTSVYLVDTVLPMLPTKLSNDLCSLNPNSDKLTLSVFMEINNNGDVIKHEIVESVICSKARLTYKEVSDFLNGTDDSFSDSYPNLVEEIRLMEELTHVLMEKREKRGTINFNFPEAKIHLNNEGDVVDVCKYDRGFANQLIEEFMIVCNETVAEAYYEKNLPFLFRTHENPRELKIQDFYDYIQLRGYVNELDSIEFIEPKQLQLILKEAKERGEEQTISLLLLQSMQQARYTAEARGHFGLASEYYCHFTSPIRRYPDLQIHRIIKESLKGTLTNQRVEQLADIVEANGKACSRKERIAGKAEDDLKELKKLEYMRTKVGERYNGVITKVTPSGFTVTLDNTIEGFVSILSLKDDCYELNKLEHCFIGTHSDKRKSLGEQIHILVEHVNVETREILFRL